MKSQARAVVIGGGIAGCSTLYHLTQEGWTDVVLIERDELTSGTTWHSAAQVTNFGTVQTMVGLKSHSIRLYAELAADPDYPIDYHQRCGGIRLASSADHLDGYHHFVSMAKGMGVDFEVIDAAECGRRHPLLSTDGLLGGLWDPLDGDIDPAQLCQALARRARRAGARIYRHNPVEAIEQKANHEWRVHTRNGTITCEKVVNACGYRVNEVGAMMGVTHPVISMEHQYFLTQPIAQLEALGCRVPLLRDPTDDFYSRQEKHGLLVGIYEQGCQPWGLDGIDPDFANALCPDDLDRCLDNMERVFQRLPCLTGTGIHTIINGPITYSADGLPLVGKTPGLINAYSIIGLRAGVGEGGGHGKILAQIMVHGEAQWDTWCLDPRRFGSYATTQYTKVKAIEDYQNEFRFHLPHEHRLAGRPARTTPLYPVLKNAGAEFAVVNGWERAAFFKPSADFEEALSFRFNNTFGVVGQEVANVAGNVGIMEVSGFNRYRISAPGGGEARVLEWLNTLTPSRLPRANGKVSLAYFLTERGNLLAEATLARLPKAANHYAEVWFGSAAAEQHDWDWLHERKPAPIKLERLTGAYTTLVVAGPNARALMRAAAPRTDWSRTAFPWLSVRHVMVGTSPAVAMSVSFSGELAYELHVPNESLLQVYLTLREHGGPLGLKPFGSYAAESMRLEKSYPHWKAELITEFNPIEAGLARFIDRDKPAYPGKAGLEAQLRDGQLRDGQLRNGQLRNGQLRNGQLRNGQLRNGIRRKLVTLTIDTRAMPAHPGDSVMVGDAVVGTVTSAAFGHRVQQNLALAYVTPPHAAAASQVDVLILGERHSALITDGCLYDPHHERVRS